MLVMVFMGDDYDTEMMTMMMMAVVVMVLMMNIAKF